MNLDYHWINLLILFGALHGLVFGIILLSNQKHPGAKFLAIFILILSYNGFETFSWSSGLDNYTTIFQSFSFVWIFGLGPSLFFYLWSLLKPKKVISNKKLLMAYSPVIFQFFLSTCIRILSINFAAVEITLIESDMLYDFYVSYSEPLSVIVFWLYLIFSVKILSKTEKQNTFYFSKENQKIIVQWSKSLLICVIFLGIFWPISLISASVFNIKEDVHHYPIELLLVFFIYWIAYVGYYKVKLIHRPELNINEKWISKIDAEKYLSTLRKMMRDDKPYLDPSLNRMKMANLSGVNEKTISTVLNQYANQNFNDFVNSYRIKEVMDKLESQENNHLTISGIALDSGFNSQATFQRVFKVSLGISPKQFQKRIIQKVKN